MNESPWTSGPQDPALAHLIKAVRKHQEAMLVVKEMLADQQQQMQRIEARLEGLENLVSAHEDRLDALEARPFAVPGEVVTLTADPCQCCGQTHPWRDCKTPGDAEAPDLQSEGELCWALSPNGWKCTEPEGHDGQHVSRALNATSSPLDLWDMWDEHTLDEPCPICGDKDCEAEEHEPPCPPDRPACEPACEDCAGQVEAVPMACEDCGAPATNEHPSDIRRMPKCAEHAGTLCCQPLTPDPVEPPGCPACDGVSGTACRCPEPQTDAPDPDPEPETGEIVTLCHHGLDAADCPEHGHTLDDHCPVCFGSCGGFPEPVPEWRALVDEYAAEDVMPQIAALSYVLHDLADIVGENRARPYAELARIVAICEEQVGGGWQADPDAAPYPRRNTVQWLMWPLTAGESKGMWAGCAARAASWLRDLTDGAQ